MEFVAVVVEAGRALGLVLCNSSAQMRLLHSVSAAANLCEVKYLFQEQNPRQTSTFNKLRRISITQWSKPNLPAVRILNSAVP